MLMFPKLDKHRSGNSSTELEKHLSRLFSDDAFIRFLDGSMQSFVRLTILDLLYVNCEISRKSMSSKKAYESHIDTTRTSFRSHLYRALSYADLSDMAKQMLTVFQVTRDSLTSMPDTSARELLEQKLPDLEMRLSEYYDLTEKIIARYNKLIELSKDAVDVNEAEAVRRLTTLATVFLPLSLASSILAMGSRISELQFRLFDFVGLALILGSLALIIYLAAMSIQGHFRVMYRFLNHRGIYSVSKIVGQLVWGLALAAFIVGMAKDVILGLKILGYGFAAILGLSLLIFIPVGEMNRRWKGRFGNQSVEN
jgi:hypothetical protein